MCLIALALLRVLREGVCQRYDDFILKMMRLNFLENFFCLVIRSDEQLFAALVQNDVNKLRIIVCAKEVQLCTNLVSAEHKVDDLRDIGHAACQLVPFLHTRSEKSTGYAVCTLKHLFGGDDVPAVEDGLMVHNF